MTWPSFGDLRAALSLNLSHKLTIAAASAALIACPQSIRESLKAESFLADFGWIILLIFFLSSASCLVEISGIYIDKYKTKKRLKIRNIETITKLRSLDYSEKAVLREMLNGRKTINLPVDHSTVRGLVNDGIITIVGKVATASREGRLVACRISDTSVDYLESIAITDFIKIVGYEYVSVDADGSIKSEAGFDEWHQANVPEFVRVLDRANYYSDWR